MDKITKNILVYADGRVEVLKQVLVGMHFIKPEVVDGDWWERTFDVDYVEDPTVPGGALAVGREKSFVKRYTRAEIEKMDAERRAETMKKVLWGIRNYPGDDVADKETR